MVETLVRYNNGNPVLPSTIRLFNVSTGRSEEEYYEIGHSINMDEGLWCLEGQERHSGPFSVIVVGSFRTCERIEKLLKS